MSWRTRSLIRRLCSAPCWVSRSVARTRRSKAARSAPGSSSGRRPAGSNSGSRARVSASMPLVLVCRDRKRRRSAAFCELTRNTRCPRALKNTAMGNHAGPVGSITTSSLVPAGQPLSAIRSSSPRLSRVGQALRLCSVFPSPSSTRTVCALAMPRSMPTRRRWFISSPLVVSVLTGSPAGATRTSGHGPKETRPTAAPTHVLQPDPASLDRSTSLIRGIRGRAGCGNQKNGAGPLRASPEPISTPPPGPAGMTMQPWDLSLVVDPRCRCPLHEPSRAARAARR